MISMLRRSIFAPVLISLLAACSPGGGSGASFVNTDITGASYGKDFRLTDHTGAVRGGVVLAQPQQGERNADVVVEVAGSGERARRWLWHSPAAGAAHAGAGLAGT